MLITTSASWTASAGDPATRPTSRASALLLCRSQTEISNPPVFSRRAMAPPIFPAPSTATVGIVALPSFLHDREWQSAPRRRSAERRNRADELPGIDHQSRLFDLRCASPTRVGCPSVRVDGALSNQHPVDVDVVEERGPELVGTTGSVLPFVENDE